MSTSPFRVNVADLAVGGPTRPVRITEGVDWHLDLTRVLDEPPLVADFELQALPAGVLARGTVAVRTANTCHRCLETFEEDRMVHVSVLFEWEPIDGGYAIRDAEIDLEQPLVDEVLLAVPLLPRCRPDCQGVVTKPAADLNDAFAGDPPDPGSPFAILRDFVSEDEVESGS